MAYTFFRFPSSSGCYIAEDVLVTAGKQVAKALYIDYVAAPIEVERTAYARPLDYNLFPMQHTLQLKTSIYDPPEAPELQVRPFKASKYDPRRPCRPPQDVHL
jgi:hypothetical protein